MYHPHRKDAEAKAPVSVGILAYNAAATLPRALESVKGYDDVIVADGGSTDATRKIAERYGCRVIAQCAASEKRENRTHPLSDFARERNHLLSHARHRWFLWLDADEYLSQELAEEIARIARRSTPREGEPWAYHLRMVRQSPDGAVSYREWKANYQLRFFHLGTGGRFERKIHERYVFDEKKFPIGTLKGAWYVPLSKTGFSEYRRAVNWRLRHMMAERPPATLGAALKKGVYRPLVSSLKIIGRAMLLRMRYPWRELIPLSYERNRLYGQWAHAREIWRAYLRARRSR